MNNKKWSNDELNKVIEYIKNDKTYEEISILINRTYSSTRNKIIKNKLFKYRNNDEIEIKCLNCGNIIDTKDKNRKFCNHSCSAIYNNNKRDINTYNKIKKSLIKYNSVNYEPTYNKCLFCDNDIKTIPFKIRKFCNNECQRKFQKNNFFNKIENGDLSLDNRQYKLYLINKHGNRCMECGWGEINIYTNKIPIELEHIDGNSYNNSLDNLKLLCPNCHSLTRTYKGANVGNGRHIRRERYKLGKSY